MPEMCNFWIDDLVASYKEEYSFCFWEKIYQLGSIGYHGSIQQHHCISSFSLDAIEEYFAQLNPIAKRIAYDINGTKANYGHIWDTLDYHEQNDIINDSLIKPEISLRYFGNFLTPTPSNSSGNSYQSSTDSLTATVLKDVCVSRQNEADQENGEKKKISLKTYGVNFNHQGIKQFYSYDGRNLHTFGMQKVALKVIQDDILGCFRDEHSPPFCYRTKSQIDLFVLPSQMEPLAARKNIVFNKIIAGVSKNPALKSTKEEDSKKTLDNYQRLQHQLKINLKEKKSQDSQNSLISYASIKPSEISASRKLHKSPDTSYKQESKDKTPPISKNTTKSSMIQNYITSAQMNVASKMGNSYAVFSDAYNTAEESFTLLQHCGQSDLNIGSCSSAATSDDEKTLEEDVHLLDNDSNIRKGFDFLNNW